MWRRNVESIPGVLGRLERALDDRVPALVAAVQPVDSLDSNGRVEAILAQKYRRVAVVDGVPIYAPRRPS
jgi:hypothetical protein